MEFNTDSSLREIFLEAAEIDDPQARAAYLDKACAGHAELRRRVEALLAAEAKAGPPHEAPSSVPAIGDPALGSRISHCKLLQQIGEGGCGVVFMAEQEEPVRRKVALKVIKLGMDTKQVVARFEAERQALAMMDHPNIAKVLEAGATDTGRPYFVMELVRGLKITEYCDEHQLSTPQRLDLFMQVCHAVQHAHQKGIIHRDLKPSNVLVTEVDGKPLPKIIDFGIAKAIEGRLTDNTLFTAFEQLVGTPAYMSPEQASLATADIDTRSDIYSLGVLLYELLTGETPFDTKSLLAAGLDEMRRTISERVPARPSNRLTTMGPDQVEAVARARGSEPSRFMNLLAGDLDWIVMKCLEKERGRRYETANGLAMDLQRHLSNEPVVARPPSRLYEFQKTVRRHWVGFATTTAAIFILTAGIVATSWQAVRASRAEQQAMQERDRAVKAEQETRRERDKAKLLAAEAALELGQSKLEAGDNWGLLDFVEAYRLAEHDPVLRDIVGRRWATWHAEWDRRTLAIRGTSGRLTPGYLRFVTAYGSPVANIHDTLTGEPITGPLTHESDVTFGSFSPDGRWVATITKQGVIHLWDSRTGEPVRPPCETRIPELNRLSFSPDGSFLAGFTLKNAGPGSTNVVLLRLDDMNAKARLLPHRYPVWDARFSPDGKVLVVMAAPDNQLWRTEDAQRMGSPITVSRTGLLEFNRDGTRLAIDLPGSRGLGLLDVETQQVIQELPASPASETEAVAFSHDGRMLATVNWDGPLTIWRTNATVVARAEQRFRGRMREPLSFSHDDSMLAVGDAAGAVHVFRTSDGKAMHSLRTMRYASAQFIGNGILAGVASGETVFWDLAATPLPTSALPHDALVEALAFDRAGKLLAVGGEREVRLWSTADSSRPEHIIPMAGRVLSLTYSEAEGQFAVFTDDGSLTSINPLTGATNLIRQVERGYELSACLSPDARKLVLFRHNETVVVDTPTGVLQWPDDYSGVRSVAFRHDSQRMALGVASWTVGHYDVSGETTALLNRSDNLGGWVEGVAYHPDGGLVAANVGHHVICLYDPDSGHQLFDTYRPALDNVEILRFSPDGSLLVTAGQTSEGGHGIELWHVDPKRGLHRAGSILPSEHPINCLVVSPDNRTLAAGGPGPTRLWHLPAPPKSLEAMQSRTWATVGFQKEEGEEPVFSPQPVDDPEEVRARLTQEPRHSISPLDAALDLPPAEALAAIQSLADRHPETSVYREHLSLLHENLLLTNAVKGLWAEALVHADQTLRLGGDDPNRHCRSALLVLGAGDFAGYRARCRAMLARYQSSKDPAVIRWVVSTAVLRPGALDDYMELVEQVRRSVPLAGGVDGPAYRFYLGAALARAGEYEEAVTEMEQVDHFLESTGTQVNFSPTYYKFLLAICHTHLGQHEKARQWFNDAMADVRNFQQTQHGYSAESWGYALVLELLQKEAETVMNTLAPAGAPSN